MADEKLPGLLELTPLNPSFNQNPHAMLDTLREKCPVYRDEGAGVFVLTKHADVRGVLSDTSMWRSPERAEEKAVVTRAILGSRPEGLNVDEDEERSGILLMDEPDHMRIREPFAKALYKRVAKSRPKVQQVVNEWLDGIGNAKTFDVMDKFALRELVDVIARLLGVDNARLVEFREWSEGSRRWAATALPSRRGSKVGPLSGVGLAGLLKTSGVEGPVFVASARATIEGMFCGWTGGIGALGSSTTSGVTSATRRPRRLPTPPRHRRATLTWFSAAPRGTAGSGSPTRASVGSCTPARCTAARPGGTCVGARTAATS